MQSCSGNCSCTFTNFRGTCAGIPSSLVLVDKSVAYFFHVSFLFGENVTFLLHKRMKYIPPLCVCFLRCNLIASNISGIVVKHPHQLFRVRKYLSLQFRGSQYLLHSLICMWCVRTKSKQNNVPLLAGLNSP